MITADFPKEHCSVVVKESRIQGDFLRKISRMDGVWAVKYPGGIYGRAGTPDVLLSVMGRFVAIEFKVPGNKPTQIQLLMQKKIRSTGSISEICDNVDDAIEIVEKVIRGEL